MSLATASLLNQVLVNLPLRKERGRVLMDEIICVPGSPGVWTIGDCASIPNPDSDGFTQGDCLAI